MYLVSTNSQVFTTSSRLMSVECMRTRYLRKKTNKKHFKLPRNNCPVISRIVTFQRYSVHGYFHSFKKKKPKCCETFDHMKVSKPNSSRLLIFQENDFFTKKSIFGIRNPAGCETPGKLRKNKSASVEDLKRDLSINSLLNYRLKKSL